MNGYVCFWGSQRFEVYADSSYDAQCKAVSMAQAKTRKKVKSYDVTVMLAEKHGSPVTHSGGEL